MKKIFKFVGLSLLIGSSLSLTGCKKESNLTRVCTIKTVNGMNLYLTAMAKGNVSNTYVYLGEAGSQDNLNNYATEVYDKVTKQRPNCDVAYFPLDEYGTNAIKELYKKEKTKDSFKVVFIDSYKDATSEELVPTGIWLGRTGWINNSGTSKKFIAGLAKTANYRVSAMKIVDEKGNLLKESTNDSYQMAYRDFKDQEFKTFREMYTYMDQNQKKLPDFVFKESNESIADKVINYKSIYEYCAIFAFQNRGNDQPFKSDSSLNTFLDSTKDNKDAGKKQYINNETSINLFGQIKDILKVTSEGKEADIDKEISEDGNKIINKVCEIVGQGKDDLIQKDSKDRYLSHMRYGNYQTAHPSTSSGNMKQVILYSAIGGSVALIVIVLLIIRRVKTGRKLFDVRRALDIDIPLDNPVIARRIEVGKGLRKLREDKGLTVEQASKELHLPVSLIRDYLETGDLLLTRGQKKKYINFYNLPEDYFDKAYIIEDVK